LHFAKEKRGELSCIPRYHVWRFCILRFCILHGDLYDYCNSGRSCSPPSKVGESEGFTRDDGDGWMNGWTRISLVSSNFVPSFASFSFLTYTSTFSFFSLAPLRRPILDPL